MQSYVHHNAVPLSSVKIGLCVLCNNSSDYKLHLLSCWRFGNPLLPLWNNFWTKKKRNVKKSCTVMNLYNLSLLQHTSWSK